MPTAKTTAKKTTAKTAEPKATKATKATAVTTSAQQTATVIPDIEAASSPSEAPNLDPVMVTVQQDVFTKAIETVTSAIPMTQGHAALLDRVRLTTDQVTQTLTLTGFNLILGMEVSLPANVEGSGDWSVSASKLLRLMQHFPTGAVTLSWAPGETMSIVSRTAGPFNMATRLADDCPTVPVPEAPQSFALTNLRWGLKCAILCAGAEDFRCVHMHFWLPPAADKDATPKASVTLTSTKKEAVLGFYYDVADSTDLELPDRTVSVAGESLQKLVGLLGDQPCQVDLDTVSTEDVVVRFVVAPVEPEKKLVTEATAGITTVVTCRTDKVEAMNGSGFMPPDPLPVEISVDRSQLVQALNRQAVITDKQAAVAISVGDNELTLSSEGVGVGVGTDTLSAQVTGDPMTIKFNPEFLLECLQALQSNQARLSFNSPTDAAYIRDSERPTLFFVLAPAG